MIWLRNFFFYCEAFLRYDDYKRRDHRCSVVLGCGFGLWAGLEIKCLYLFRFTGVIMVSATSQLKVLASHKTNFESVAQRRLGIRHGAIWAVPFLSDPCVFGYIF